MKGNIKGNNKGFTLIELTVAIAIIVILTALLLPTVVSYVSDADKATGKANAKTIYNAAVQVAASNQDAPGQISSGDTDKIKKSIGGGIDEVIVSPDDPGNDDLADGVAYIQTDANGIPIAAYYASSDFKYP